ncbi:MAG TPA: glutamine amidotransferase, partial [Rhodobacteraceae bacterium]|nr:glutamine amidotransferase [Paracoccaceae bacterium]
MHLAILMTNTDETPFADDHPRDGEKFQILLNEARPDWTFEIFTAKDGVFPND